MSEDTEELSERLGRLLGLMTADLEARLVRELLADLTPAERRKLRAHLLMRADQRLDAYVEKALEPELRRVVNGWVSNHATEAVRGPLWQRAAARIAERVGTYLAEAVEGEDLAKLLQAMVPPAMQGLVRSKLQELLRPAVATDPPRPPRVG